MAKKMTARCLCFFIRALQDPLANLTNPAQSREGYTRCIVWKYYTNAWYSIGKVKFSKTSYAIPKLHQYLPGNFVEE